MANYTTNTSDKRKKTALIFWVVGAIGLLGFEYFYVGKIKKAFIKLCVGLLVLMVILTLMGTSGFFAEGYFILALIFWGIMALPNLIRLLLGVFKDNVGAPLRR